MIVTNEKRTAVTRLRDRVFSTGFYNSFDNPDLFPAKKIANFI
jgi:hypothetical protein